ncbi:testicular haploid expressed gene protein isoform X2 [Ailuropoda melanoleuca]|uniref:testicular haploid expressed gene protein isoform X2 n=1 Tax=Ailuropoda melanoleuca TaxID=9646 RepID=UPI0009481E58|nr:testicular haploid expressed gene protein isoform X2 [Ailuropoda melanoleuca]
MGDQWQSSPLNHRSSEAGGRPDGGRDNEVPGMGMQGVVSRSRRTTDTGHPHDGELRFEDQEEETLPEEVTGEEVPSPRNPEVALEQLDRVLEKDAEESVSEMSRLSITQRFPSFSSVRGRKRRGRAFELAKPKTNWQVLKDRLGCCCEGYAWVSPRRRSLEFCVYWPSVYWTERFLEDTTLTITVPEVSRRVEELARPKRFYSEYYNNNRTTPIWPVPRSSLEYQASSRLRELAAPRVRNNIWSINMSEHPRPSRTSVFLTEIHAGRCWTSPRRQWPVPGSSPWPSPKCARTSTRATTPTIFPQHPWLLGHPLGCTSLPPPRTSPKKCERPGPGL